ncbi:MAG: gyrase subunit [Patescibacteria group bacterium]|nr:gyrase subunit [Patescibacteria group bacterium]
MASKKKVTEEESDDNKDQNTGETLNNTKEISDRITPIPIVEEMRKSYLDYAMSVITSRALPDVRDGLKPVHRRIIYSMYKNGLTPTSKFKKSATVVGDVLGSYHPHGDASVYDAMVQLAQEFKTRYPLVLGQGNFGSIDGDGAAAYRYTEAKMSKVSSEMVSDIEKETVDMRPNYDGSKKEPVILPTMVPNLLLNGTLGIAVGMATSIPPHNMNEIMDATTYLIDNPGATTEDLCEYVKGPDFPTGAMAFNQVDIRHAYATGRGGVLVRGEAEIVEQKNGQFQIIVTSIPFRVNKKDLLEKVADLVSNKKLEGIKAVRDESAKDIRIVFDLKSGTQPEKLLNQLYKYTEIESTFHYNMVALVDGIPQTVSLKTALAEFVKHRKIVVTRRTQFELNKALAREHILFGLKKALDHIDEIIKLIRASKDTEEAHAALIKKFKFSDIQATAILEMKLQRLAGLERKKIEDELKAVQALIEDLKSILASEKKILKIIKDELLLVKEKFGDARRTKIVKHGIKDFNPEDLIAEEDSVLVYTKGGYIKRTNPEEFRTQKRGGVGVVDLDTKEEDFITITLTASTHADLLFFTDKGKVYQLKMYDIAEGKRATRGKSVMNYLQLTDGEKVTSILEVPKNSNHQELSIMMVTKLGTAKKSSAESFKDVRRSGIIGIRLDEGDELVNTLLVSEGDSVILTSLNGQSIRYDESDVRQMGRTAGGVIAMNLDKGDIVMSAQSIRKGDKQSKLLIITEHGYGKMTPLSEYKIQKRGGSGIKTVKVTDKTGKLVAARVIDGEVSEILAVSKASQVIKTEISSIAVSGRDTQGVRIMKMRDGDGIASFSLL